MVRLRVVLWLFQRSREVFGLPEAQTKAIRVQKIRAPAAGGLRDRGDDGHALFGERRDHIVNAALPKIEDQRRCIAALALLLEKDRFKAPLEGGGEPAAAPEPAPAAKTEAAPQAAAGAREEQRVPMTRIRTRIAERLVEAQSAAAMLTTFNEVDLQAVGDLRKRYKETFEKEHGVKLGYMSFFVKAACEALKRFPVVNASIDGNDIVYHAYYDVGIAVSAPRGLVVPILRDADTLGFGEVEKRIGEFGQRARDNKLTMDELTGGTFSITNGGVFGSLVSTPILNPPQSAILGMHGINERPVVVDGEITIRPMMWLALTYDHRIIDGRDAVLFLRAIKDFLEDPAKLLLDI